MRVCNQGGSIKDVKTSKSGLDWMVGSVQDTPRGENGVRILADDRCGGRGVGGSAGVGGARDDFVRTLVRRYTSGSFIRLKDSDNSATAVTACSRDDGRPRGTESTVWCDA